MKHEELLCLFVSDLHGNVDKFSRLFSDLVEKRPKALFVGGDILPSGISSMLSGDHCGREFLLQFVVPQLAAVRQKLGADYPAIFIILGNDDGSNLEPVMGDISVQGLWHYLHNRTTEFLDYNILGYSFVPPTPFMLKDWERYDVSRFVDAGCIAPEDGIHLGPMSSEEIRYATIEKDLRQLSAGADMKRSIFLFHTPPYQTKLDRAELDGKRIDGVELDRNIGSIAVRRFIERQQPLLTLHGHVHESPRLTGSWQDEIGATRMFSAAHDGPELAEVWFDLDNLEKARRELHTT